MCFYNIESTLCNHLKGDKKRHTGSVKEFELEELDDDNTLEWFDGPATVIQGQSGFLAANEALHVVINFLVQEIKLKPKEKLIYLISILAPNMEVKSKENRLCNPFFIVSFNFSLNSLQFPLDFYINKIQWVLFTFNLILNQYFVQEN